MTTHTPSRIIELWPSHSLETRRKIVEFAASNGSEETTLHISTEAEVLPAQVRDDFPRGGRRRPPLERALHPIARAPGDW